MRYYLKKKCVGLEEKMYDTDALHNSYALLHIAALVSYLSEMKILLENTQMLVHVNIDPSGSRYNIFFFSATDPIERYSPYTDGNIFLLASWYNLFIFQC